LTGSAYVKYKRGDKSSNKGTTSVVPLNPDGSVDFNETVSITSTLLRNIKTHQFEPKNISFTVCLTDVRPPTLSSTSPHAVFASTLF